MTCITKAARRLKSSYGSKDPYDFLRKLPPGLMLDVGAAAGWMTDKMLAISPQSRVIAFEPFSGNHPFIESRFAGDPRRMLIKKAVSNHSGHVKFFVSSTVRNGSGVWNGMDGYSSVGMVIPDGDERNAVTVECCTLDDVVTEPVRFLKIDVQGHEFEVLCGAGKLFDHLGVELALVEFQGDERIVSFFAKRGYALLDTEYWFPRQKTKLSPAKWRTLGSMQSSTGRAITLATPLRAPEDPKAYCKWFSKQLHRHERMWTDLIAISPASSLLRERSLLSQIIDKIRMHVGS